MAQPGFAKSHTPLPHNAYDGGILSAESLGRGGSVASNHGTMASGSENPAALIGAGTSSLYVTTYIGETSEVPEQVLRSSQPIENKVLQYMSMGAEKGTIYYEPLGRFEQEMGGTETEFSADAIGFAAAAPYKGGSIGLSIAYLHGSLNSTVRQAGQPDQSNMDTGEGVRMNIGFRYPTGPVMWGLVLKNAPGFLWWKDYKKDTLPFSMRVGNTWRIKPGVLYSLEYEIRDYNKGKSNENILYTGAEASVTKTMTFRGGVFSNDINDPTDRHWTGGVSWNFSNDVSIAYALESFEFDKKRVKKSILSVSVPLSFEQEP